MNTFVDRIAALHPFVAYGPGYRRGVADALADARLFFGREGARSGEHCLLVAEHRADLIDIGRFEADDPTGPCWVGVTDGLATWGGDGSSGSAQRDRVRAALVNSGFSWLAGGPASDLPIALSILVATGVLDASTPRPTSTLGLDGRTGGTACDLGADTLGDLVERHRGVGTANRAGGVGSGTSGEQHGCAVLWGIERGERREGRVWRYGPGGPGGPLVGGQAGDPRDGDTRLFRVADDVLVQHSDSS